MVYVPSFALGTRQPAAGAQRTSSGRPTVVFLGALDVATNHDAVAWFAEHSWPLVRAAVPDCRWYVVGRRPTTEVRSLVSRTAGAELHADVAEPAAFLAAADVSINPAVSGSGVNIKLVEYLAAGAPVVSTSRGSSGLGLRPGRRLLVADTPAGFAAAVGDLLTGRRDGGQLGAAGQAHRRCDPRHPSESRPVTADAGMIIPAARPRVHSFRAHEHYWPSLGIGRHRGGAGQLPQHCSTSGPYSTAGRMSWR